jgi:hypothetical protein
MFGSCSFFSFFFRLLVCDFLSFSFFLCKISSEQRIKALEASEKSRQLDKMMQKGDEFEEELKGFVGDKKFKKTGGIEEVERQRQERDRENLKAGMKKAAPDTFFTAT